MIMDRVEVLRAACCLAAADQEITDDERARLHRMADRIGVGGASLRAMMDRAVEDPQFFKKQFDFLKGDRENAMKQLFLMAITDEKLGEGEMTMLRHFAEKLDISEDRFRQFVAAAEKRTNGDG